MLKMGLISLIIAFVLKLLGQGPQDTTWIDSYLEVFADVEKFFFYASFVLWAVFIGLLAMLYQKRAIVIGWYALAAATIKSSFEEGGILGWAIGITLSCSLLIFTLFAGVTAIGFFVLPLAEYFSYILAQGMANSVGPEGAVTSFWVYLALWLILIGV